MYLPPCLFGQGGDVVERHAVDGDEGVAVETVAHPPKTHLLGAANPSGVLEGVLGTIEQVGLWQWENGIGIVVAIALYVAFVVRQRTTRTPLMDLRLMTRRPVVAGIFLIFMAIAQQNGTWDTDP
ncbi:hypothetical protein [Microbacterium maritypicum]|uniref:hypothetical protein n=1 Tax=Microbacterium maritypicum TaxID=33918 RepID=UPI00142EDCEE|nr:hypothetical protein [Microbacterium liquefaciens]